MDRNVTIRIGGLIGVASPFRQGGSLRLTLPRRIARKYAPRGSELEDLEFPVFFIETNIGVLMCTWSDLTRRSESKEISSTIADLIYGVQNGSFAP